MSLEWCLLEMGCVGGPFICLLRCLLHVAALSHLKEALIAVDCCLHVTTPHPRPFSLGELRIVTVYTETHRWVEGRVLHIVVHILEVCQSHLRGAVGVVCQTP
ncbi:hypothetical protein BDP55DRAFT_263640 [Colletotrichum godetiae]|uniref:Uncharacterized protein n=1 Tax=Colletotrichum godetiae TaxID=1209918 RepID=A0AAJ0AVZ8_9PEZI|nr:uncharacterized protein BDP55DRAFT_263640 [Colletotrichum godetiae]KAK1691401.1 hypothetical protein BDP55DRAFT_263640 [Colletotrichum godetiae]